MQDSRLDQLWKDPAHWTSIGLYRCAEDPRWWVHKRVPWMGWTINIAHRGAIGSLIALIVVTTLPPILLSVFGSRGRSPAQLALALGLPCVVILAFVIWVARRDSDASV